MHQSNGGPQARTHEVQHFAGDDKVVQAVHDFLHAARPVPLDPGSGVSAADHICADMALTKWFLCGAEGAFEKDEGLAYTFAEKAARKGLPSAEFAMGYYFEVGIGVRADVEKARVWYEKVRFCSLFIIRFFSTVCMEADEER